METLWATMQSLYPPSSSRSTDGNFIQHPLNSLDKHRGQNTRLLAIPYWTLRYLAASVLACASAGAQDYPSLSSVTGMKLMHVPYKGDAPGTIDLVAGQIAIALFPPISLLPHVKSGRLRALAVTSLERSRVLPDTRTVAESGYPGFESASWNGIAVRAGTPETIVRRLHKEIATMLTESQQVRANIESSGSKVVANTPEQFGDYVRGEIVKWRRVVAAAAIKID